MAAGIIQSRFPAESRISTPRRPGDRRASKSRVFRHFIAISACSDGSDMRIDTLYELPHGFRTSGLLQMAVVALRIVENLGFSLSRAPAEAPERFCNFPGVGKCAFLRQFSNHIPQQLMPPLWSAGKLHLRPKLKVHADVFMFGFTSH